jgi:predicted DNA-binding transcriptional regulator YafY
MPLNKKALMRYRALDKCLSNTTRQYTARDLLKEIERVLEMEGYEKGIVKSQLHDDLRHMREFWKAPIVSEKDPLDKRIVLYKYEDSNFSIEKQPISEAESNIIKEALTVLSRFKGMPQFEWVNEIVPAIENKLGLITLDREIISFEANWDYEGLKFFTPVFNAISNQRVLKITYQDFKSPEPYTLYFHPYYLKQYNSRWFAFGLNSDRNTPNWNLALDRIIEIAETQKKYTFSNINWEEYFEDFIGVTKTAGAKLVIVKLWVSPAQAPYIKTKPLHFTQKYLREDASGLELTIEIIPNYELEKVLLSYGESIRVLEPVELKNKLFQRYNDCLNN